MKKLNLVTVWGLASTHGAWVHWLLAVYSTPANGTLSPRPGTVKVCATPQVVSEFTTETAFR